MRFFRKLARELFIACAILLTPGMVRSQQPTPEQIRARLESGPDIVNRLRDEVARRGLTADQVRARLRAAGYPESLLDQYLSDSASPATSAPPDSLIDVVAKLGLVDTATARMLRADTMGRDSLPRRWSGVVDGLPIFGLDVFRSATTRFEPSLTAGVGPDYRIGPGDVLALIITGETEKAYSLDVSREGFILIPSVGQVYVANLTIAQLQGVLLSRLRQAYSSISLSPNASTRFYVTVSRIHANQVFVIGEVLNPGSYQISSVGTVLTALYAAGGPNDNGTLRRVQIQRGGQVVATVDLYDYLVRGDASHDTRLESGDVLFVGVHGGRASIRGEVVRQAVYELTNGETLSQLIDDAGGFTSEAARQRVQVRRILPPDQREPGGRDRVVLDVSLANFAGTTPPFVLLPGDRIEVFGITSRERTSIAVAGSVWSPGRQGFRSGMHLSEAIKAAGGVKPDVYLDEVSISRLQADGTRRSLHAELVDSVGTLRSDLALQEDDSIRVYARSEFVPARYVAITGAVRRGGQYPYRSGMTLRELLLSAGGPLESADLREAEVARFPAVRGKGELARTFRVPLDSSYLLDRRPNGSNDGPPGNPLPSGHAPEVVLQPYDNVLILRQPEWRELGTVWVGGEVNSPGSYTIRSTSEHLSQLVARAGGLTAQADPAASIFYRREDDAGRIGIDIGRALQDSRSQDNFVVRPGDSIVIGTYKPYVQVKGAVNSPVTVAYARGQSIGYYIAAAGGLSHKADGDRAYVRQPNGSVESRQKHWLFPDRDPAPGPGSTVFVPEKEAGEKSDYAAVAGVVAPVLASLLTIITLIVRR